MARVNAGSHSFTCHPHVLSTSGMRRSTFSSYRELFVKSRQF